MRWFTRERRQDIWDEPVAAPLGDIEAAERIRMICQSATPSAEIVGGNVRVRSEKQRGREGERFERAARAAMEIAMKISDDLMRDDAVRRIVDLCMKANDTKTGQILFRAVQTVWVREAMLKDYPALAK
jgi:hypothetical protein